MIWIISAVILLIIYILIKITHYRRINHKYTTYNRNPLKNKNKRHYHYQNNRQNLNNQNKKPYDALLSNPKNKEI